MKHLDGTYDLSVDDIHEIRLENSKIMENMTNEEIINYINNETREIRSKLRKNKKLQLV